MTFRPGESGNLAGRRPGARNKRTILRECLAEVFEGGERGFWRAVAQQAREGDSTAAGMLARRLMPELKSESAPLNVQLPQDMNQAANQVVNLAACGKVTVEGAQALLAGMASALKVKELTDLEDRVRALEGRKGA
jgi:hypothetical protein